VAGLERLEVDESPSQQRESKTCRRTARAERREQRSIAGERALAVPDSKSAEQPDGAGSSSRQAKRAGKRSRGNPDETPSFHRRVRP
jgi:hypothetical protein